YVGNPKAQLFVSTEPYASDDGPFEITAEAYFDGIPIAEGVNMTGLIELSTPQLAFPLAQPDSFKVPIFFEADGISGQHKAVINPLGLPGLGVYTVRVRAEVSEGASWQQGEGFNPDVPQLPRHTVPEFVRETTAQFGLNTTRITPIPD